MTLSDRSGAPAFRQALTRVFPRSSNTHWLNIAAMLADAAFEIDASGRFMAFGQATILGYPTGQLVGRHISDFCKLIGKGSGAADFSGVYATLNQSLNWRGAVTVIRADGGQGNYQMSLAPKPPERGEARNPGRESAMGAYGLLIELGAFEAAPSASEASPMLDPQTGLWTAPAFAEESGRRFDRLDVEGLPGTLLLLGFSRVPAVGRNAVAIRLAQELRDVSRPTDVVGRIDPMTFALWCDGMDDLTGAERAAKFCQRLPAALPGNPSISVGLVARWPGNMEEPPALIKQAETALRHAERVAAKAAEAGSNEQVAKGTWRVWNPKL